MGGAASGDAHSPGSVRHAKGKYRGPSTPLDTTAADLVRSIVVVQEKSELLNELVTRLQNDEPLRKKIQSILFDWPEMNGPNLPLQRMCEYGKKSKRLTCKLAVVRFTTLLARDLPRTSCNPLLDQGYEGILADVLSLRSEELGLHPGTVAAWGQPQRIMQDDVMLMVLTVLQHLAPYPLFSQSFVLTGGPEVLAQFLLYTEQPKRVLLVLYELFQGNEVRLSADEKHVSLLESAIHSGDVYSRQAASGILHGFLSDSNDFHETNVEVLMNGKVVECFMSALALARQHCMKHQDPKADLLAQLVANDVITKKKVPLMDFNAPLEDLFLNTPGTDPIHVHIDDLAWIPHLLLAVRQFLLLMHRNHPVPLGLMASVVCLLEVTEGPIGEKNNLKQSILTLLQAMSDKQPLCEALVSSGVSQAVLKALPQSTEQMRLSGLKTLRNVIRHCANVRFDVMLDPKFLDLLPQLFSWTPPVVVSTMWVLDGMLPKKGDGTDVPYLVKSVVINTIIPALCRTLVQTLQRLYSNALDASALQDTIVQAIVPLLCRIAASGYAEVIAQCLVAYHAVAAALLQATDEEEDDEFRTLAVQEAWIMFMDENPQGLEGQVTPAGVMTGNCTQFSNTGVYVGPDPNWFLRPVKTLSQHRTMRGGTITSVNNLLLTSRTAANRTSSEMISRTRPSIPPSTAPLASHVGLTKAMLDAHRPSAVTFDPSLDQPTKVNTPHVETRKSVIKSPGHRTSLTTPLTRTERLSSITGTEWDDDDHQKQHRWETEEPMLKDFFYKQQEKLIDEESQCRQVCMESEAIAFDIVLMRAQATLGIPLTANDDPVMEYCPANELNGMSPLDLSVIAVGEPADMNGAYSADIPAPHEVWMVEDLADGDAAKPRERVRNEPLVVEGLPLDHHLISWEEERRRVLEDAQEDEFQVFDGMRGAARSILMERLGANRKPMVGRRSKHPHSSPVVPAAEVHGLTNIPADGAATQQDVFLEKFSLVAGGIYQQVTLALGTKFKRIAKARPPTDCLHNPGAALRSTELPTVLKTFQVITASVQQSGLTSLLPRLHCCLAVLYSALRLQAQATNAATEALRTLLRTPAVRSSQLSDIPLAIDEDDATGAISPQHRPSYAALTSVMYALELLQAMETAEEDVLRRLVAELVACQYTNGVQCSARSIFQVASEVATQYLGEHHPLTSLAQSAATDGVPTTYLPFDSTTLELASTQLPGTPVARTAAPQQPLSPARTRSTPSVPSIAVIRGPRVTPAKYQAMLTSNLRG